MCIQRPKNERFTELCHPYIYMCMVFHNCVNPQYIYMCINHTAQKHFTESTHAHAHAHAYTHTRARTSTRTRTRTRTHITQISMKRKPYRQNS